jgi:hypothetical protein
MNFKSESLQNVNDVSKKGQKLNSDVQEVESIKIQKKAEINSSKIVLTKDANPDEPKKKKKKSFCSLL